MPFPAQKYSPQIQKRDLDFLRGLYESRVMTIAHAAALYFDEKPEAAKKRIQKLKTAGLIGERPRKPYEPAVHVVTPKAFRLLQEHGKLDGLPELSESAAEKRTRVSDLTLRHELDVMSVKAALASAIRKTDCFSVVEFSTWPAMYQFEVERRADGQRNTVLVKPDGFIRIHEQEADGGLSQYTFFLEVDRSTETLGVLVNRIRYYVEYYRQGGMAIRNGRPAEEYKNYPFRVLIVCKRPERRDNISTIIQSCNPPITSQIWLTTISEIISHPLGEVWVIAKKPSHMESLLK